MKSNKLLLCALSLTGILGGLQIASAAETFAFSVPGSIPGTTGYVKDYDNLNASGTVTFDGTSVTLFIENGDDIASAIDKIFLLKPMGIDADSLDSVKDENGDPIPTWELANNLDDGTAGKPGTILKNNPGPFNFNPYDADAYFGAYSDNKGGGNDSRIFNGDSATFTFTMESSMDSVNWADYGDATHPTIVIRWQSIPTGPGSSAGYSWLDVGGTAPGVPEPRLIAPLAVLSLGGLLYVRRRITRKGKKA